MRREEVPQEAFIGIVYATAAAMTMLFLSKASGEAEHLKSMLMGNVLLVSWSSMSKTALIYAAIGAFHFAFRRPFLCISLNPEEAEAEGLRLRLWDFFFYLSFGLVITSSVAIAGVLMVFSYLVVPAACAMMFSRRIGVQIALSWGVGSLCSLIGMIVSYYGDLPTGPVVVACFAGFLILAGILRYFLLAEVPLAALGRVGFGILLVVALTYGSLNLRKKNLEDYTHQVQFESLINALQGQGETAQLEAIHHLAEDRDPHAVPALLALLRDTRSDRVIEHLVRALPVFRSPSVVPSLLELAERDVDAFLKVEVANAILRLRDPGGIPILIGFLEENEVFLARKKALELLREVTGQSFDYRVEASAEENAVVIRRWKAWWGRRGEGPTWHEQRRRFE
jgi:hypothetical protein